jgi:hypothetical protein
MGHPMGRWPELIFLLSKKRSSLVLYIGCVGMSTETETATHAIELLQRIGIDFTIIDEVCCEAVKDETGSKPNPDRIKQNIDKIKEYTPATSYPGWEPHSTNPCSEIAMNADTCRLIAVNMFSFVENPYTKDAKFKF